MAEFGKWIPVKWRKMTEEEKEEYFDAETDMISDFALPEDGDEILISGNNGMWVSVVEFCNDIDYGIGDDYGHDWLTEVDAWMPLPEGYKKEGGTEC